MVKTSHFIYHGLDAKIDAILRTKRLRLKIRVRCLFVECVATIQANALLLNHAKPTQRALCAARFSFDNTPGSMTAYLSPGLLAYDYCYLYGYNRTHIST